MAGATAPCPVFADADPGAHSVHAVAPPAYETLPGAHCEHDADPDWGSNEPAAHFEQLVRPGLDDAEPGAHGAHVTVVELQNDPAAQGVHSTAPLVALSAGTEPEAQQNGPPGALYVYDVMYEGAPEFVDLHATHELAAREPAAE